MTKPLPPGLKRFADFWPYYVQEHLHPVSRILHVLGSLLVLLLLTGMAISGEWKWIWLVPFCGYGMAWIGHYVFERNRPATFQYPFFSLLGDFVMLYKILTGKMKNDLEHARKNKN